MRPNSTLIEALLDAIRKDIKPTNHDAVALELVQAAALEKLPVAVQRMAKSKNKIYLKETVAYVDVYSFYAIGGSDLKEPKGSELSKRVTALKWASRAARDEADTLIRNLRSSFRTFKSFAKLREAYPQFSKYIDVIDKPAEPKTVAVSALKQAGWVQPK